MSSVTTVRRASGSPSVVALFVAGCLAILILGPALFPGLVIAYDMVWVPGPTWTPFVLGVGTPAPRAVPGDAVVVVVSSMVTAGVGQKAILLGVLVLAGTGAAALLRQLRPTSSTLAGVAAVVAAMWNPFVTERLAIGHWSVLLGYGVLPWLIRSVLRLSAGAGSGWAVSGWIVLAALGGANPMVIVLAGFGILILGPIQWRAACAAGAVWLGSAAVWALPALGGPASRLTDGMAEFAPSADTPYGVIVSLLSGGGFWSVATHPVPRSNWLIALLASLLAAALAVLAANDLWRRGGRSVLAVAVVSLLVCIASALPITADLWSTVLSALPGGGLLRDSHKLLAPWVVLLSLGAGVAVDSLISSRLRRDWSPAAAIVITVAPMALLPTLAWGVGGRLQAVEVPEDYVRVASIMSELPPGVVGLLPWNQYRRYEWNGSRISLTLAPRAIDQLILFDDSLPLTDGRVAGEDPRAFRVTRRTEAGMTPAEALIEEGVDYLAIEVGAGEDVEIPYESGKVVARSTELVVIEVNRKTGASVEPEGRLVLGWLVTLATWGGVVIGATLAHLLRRSRRV